MVKSDRKIDSQAKKAMSLPSSSSSLSLSSSSSQSSCSKKVDKRLYKGVRMRSWGSWVSEIRAPNQKTRIWLGSYSTPEAAARAYDAALICLKGPSANLNFPNISSSLHIPNYDEKTILSPKSIQRVAAQAANSVSFDHITPTPTPTTTIPDSPDHHHHQHDHHDNQPSPSSSSSSSSSVASSSADDHDHDHHLDDDDDVVLSLVESFGEYYSNQQVSLMDSSWYNYAADYPHNGLFFFDGASFEYSHHPPSTITIDDDLYEDGDIRLWSFS